MIRLAALALAVIGLVSAPALAGKYNKVLSIGDKAPAFSKLPGTDDKPMSFADVKDDVVVVAITCNKCPVAVDYEDRIIALQKKYQGKVSVIAINVNLAEADGIDKMKERAKEKGFNFPYLMDESQEIGRALGASRTPEFFVINKDRKVAYMGALDNDPSGEKVTKKYIEDAIESLLAGKEIAVTETAAVGCGVGYAKKLK